MLGWKRDIIKYFNTYFLISLIIFTFYHQAAGLWYIAPLNGLLTAAVAYGLKNRHYKSLSVAFAAGLLSPYITYSDMVTYIISGIICLVAIFSIKKFTADLMSFMEPEKIPKLKDLRIFGNFFVNLMATFAVINLSINALHLSGGEQAFNFGKGEIAIIDAVYFSIITMTTVGYGDIIPQTTVARVVTALECLTSYLLLGMMVAILSRGISQQAD